MEIFEYRNWHLEALENRHGQWYVTMHHPTDLSGDSDMETSAQPYLLDSLAVARGMILKHCAEVRRLAQYMR